MYITQNAIIVVFKKLISFVSISYSILCINLITIIYLIIMMMMMIFIKYGYNNIHIMVYTSIHVYYSRTRRNQTNK